MRKLKISRVFALLLVLALVCLIPFTASADNGADKKGSLSIVYFHENDPIEGATFSIYRVAELQGTDYVLVGDFTKYQVSLADISNVDTVSALTTTFAAYIARDSIAPYDKGQTHENGGLLIDGLEDGLYIGIGESTTIGDTTYIPLPFMFAIPGVSADGEPNYNIVVEPKYDLYKEGESPKTVERRALKIWDDNDNKSGKRTREITVQLLRDGNVYEEVVLNEENGWRYSWDNLPAGYQWLVIEKNLPEDYVLSMTQQGITFTLTNTYIGEEPEDPTNPNDPSNPDNPNNPNDPSNSSTSSDSTLPQTGQLWWPVPVLLIAGIVICFMGIYLKKRSENPNA